MKVTAANRRARFDYQILETIEAGVILSGQEVKSCRMGRVNLTGSYVSFRDTKPLLRHAKISPYPYTSDIKDYDPARDRVLLLSKGESLKLKRAFLEKGLAIIPLEVRAGRYVKVLLGVASGRKRHDKRERIRERETERRLRRGEEV